MKYFQALCLFIVTLQMLHSNGADGEVQPGVVLRETPVYQLPNRRSSILYQLAEDTRIYITERDKSWYKIASERRHSGWLRLLSVRYLGDPKQDFLGEVADFSADVFKIQRTGPIITTGVRGIDEEIFRSAQPDFDALEIILANTIDKKQIRRFALNGNLQIKNIDIPSSNKKEKSND